MIRCEIWKSSAQQKNTFAQNRGLRDTMAAFRAACWPLRSANGIQGTTYDVNSEPIPRGALQVVGAMFAQQIFSQYPGEAAHRRNHKIDLPHASHARLLSAGPGPILIPWLSRGRAVLFQGQLA